jgi:hypothetical protein
LPPLPGGPPAAGEEGTVGGVAGGEIKYRSWAAASACGSLLAAAAAAGGPVGLGREPPVRARATAPAGR